MYAVSDLAPKELIIHDGTPVNHVVLNGMKGCIPRDYTTHPSGCYSAETPYDAVEFPLITDPTEIVNRISDMIATKSRMSDLRMIGNNGQPIPSLDQNGKGYCWAHSSTSAVMMTRCLQGMPYVPLSAYAIACIIKAYRDEGGWGAQSLDFIMQRGVPSSQFWPIQSMSRTNDNPQTWANAALHKVTDGFIDIAVAQYDRSLSWQQIITLMLLRFTGPVDFNWWSHSVCALDIVNGQSHFNLTRNEMGKLLTLPEFDLVWGMMDPITQGLGMRILNSWGDSWSDHGMGVLTGSKARPDGCAFIRNVLASAA